MALPFPNFDPVAIAIPTPWSPLPIRWYALAYIAGILLGWLYAARLLRRTDLWGDAAPVTREGLDDLIIWLTIGVIVGGRLGYMLFYSTRTLWENPLQIFRTWEGGMSFHGGFIGFSLALVLYALKHKVNVLRLGDLAAPCAPIGLFFGRIANFVNGELWGRPTDVPWAMIFPAAGPVPRHPSQLYEAGLEGIATFLLLALGTRRFGFLKRPGLSIGAFLFLYGLFRFLLEHVREPDVGMPDFPFGLSMGMILSLPMVVAGLVVMGIALRAAPRIAAPDEGS
jgi:phosphatidylglycerol:prolipoprotein diacylglycerol transferase